MNRYDPETTSYPGSDAMGVTMSRETFGDYVSVDELRTELFRVLSCDDVVLRNQLEVLLQSLEGDYYTLPINRERI